MDDLGVHQLEMDDLGVHTITTPILGYLHASIWDVAQVANHQLGAPVGWSIPNLLTFRVQVYDLVTLVSALKKTIGFWGKNWPNHETYLLTIQKIGRSCKYVSLHFWERNFYTSDVNRWILGPRYWKHPTVENSSATRPLALLAPLPLEDLWTPQIPHGPCNRSCLQYLLSNRWVVFQSLKKSGCRHTHMYVSSCFSK